MMRTTIWGAAALALTWCGAASAEPVLRGDYVEARTLNIYTGACHANSEADTAGREAMMVWRFAEGSYQGTPLAGVTVMAAVAGDANLAQEETRRSAILYVSDRATKAQREAVTALLQEKYGKNIGAVRAVRSAPVAFAHKGNDYRVTIPGVAAIQITRYNCQHCVMEHNVWYKPFIGLKSSIVALASVNEFKDKDLQTAWSHPDENSAYVGEFEF